MTNVNPPYYVSKTMILALFALMLMGCPVKQEKSKIKDLSQILNGVEKLNVKPILNFGAYCHDRSSTGKTVIFQQRMGGQNGIAVLSIDGNCQILSNQIKYTNWKHSSIGKQTLALVKESICNLELDMIEVDSCGNTYFRTAFINQNEYVIIRDTICLDKTHTYTKFKGNCYIVK